MTKFGKEWEWVKENFYRCPVGKKEWQYMYRVKQADSLGQSVDTWHRLNNSRQPFRTLRDAETHRRKFIEEIMTRTERSVSVPDLHTIKEIFEDYIEHRGSTLAPNTISKRKGDMENHVIPYFKGRRIETITVGEVKNFVTGLRGKLAYRTVKSVLATMALVWQYAHEMGIIERGVYLEIFVDRGTKAVVPKKTQGQQQTAKKPEVFTAEQRDRFFEYAKQRSHAYYVLLMLCYYGGVRLAEALGLRWEDVDLVGQEITISRQLLYDKLTHETYISTTKSKVNRTFQVAPPLQQALTEWKSEQEKCCQRVNKEYIVDKCSGGKIPSSAFVLCDSNGLISRSQANHFREKMQNDLGEHFYYHGLRHTVVSNLAGAGVPIKSVSEFIGHADSRTTEEFYLSVDEASNSKLMAALQTL